MIDLIIVSSDHVKHAENINIDEAQINVLSKIIKKKQKGDKGVRPQYNQCSFQYLLGGNK